MENFFFGKVVNKNELREVFKLRYKVYCEEWGFEKIEEHPGEIEFDEFDTNSIHFLARDTQLKVIGTIRIILNSEKGFPIEKHCEIDADLSNVHRDKLGEISRLAVSKSYRKRAEDRFIYNGTSAYHQAYTLSTEKRKRQEIVVGLYKALYIESKKIGITHWYAVMAKGLYILLKRMGILFTPIGQEIEYHGKRTPYLGSIKDIEEEAAKTNPELLREFREALK